MTEFRRWVEILFDLVYLVAIWGLVVAMYVRREEVKAKERRVAWLMMLAFALLAFGDTGHVGARFAIALLSPRPQVAAYILGIGKAMTAVTVTLFYVVILAAWRHYFHKAYGPFEYLLLFAALVRLIMLTMPMNHWDLPTAPQPWGMIRNIPFLFQGLGVVYLILRDAAATVTAPYTGLA